MRYHVTKDWVPETETFIKLKAGERVVCKETSDPNGDWPNWVYCAAEHAEGWVPAQIIDRCGDEGIVSKAYDATELIVHKGDVVISDSSLNGWVFGYLEQTPEQLGWVPLNHLTV